MNTTALRFSILAGLASSLLGSTALAMEPPNPEPRIDFGQRFEVRLQNSVDRSGKRPSGSSKFVLGFHLEGGTSSDRVLVSVTQNAKALATISCKPSKLKYATRCESEAIPSKKIRTNAPVELSFSLENGVTDQSTALASLSLRSLATKNWVGNQGKKPIHVEERHLRQDGALSLVVIDDLADGIGYTRKDQASLRFALWNVRDPETQVKDWTMRCQVDGGDWMGYQIKVSPSIGPETVIEHRVFNRRRKDAETRRLRYERLSFQANLPFSVVGARPLEEPQAVDGNWHCQLRKDKSVQRELSWVVKDNQAQAHPGQAALYLGQKRVATSVSIGQAQLPSFDPDQAEHPYGLAQSIPGLMSSELPKAIDPKF